MSEQHIAELKEKLRKLWKEGLTKKVWEDDGPWPKIITYPDSEDILFTKAELHKDGTVRAWYRGSVNFVKLRITCPKDMKFEDFEEIITETIKEAKEKKNGKA
jgi:hypothetical protein